MKVSLNWLKDYIKLNMSDREFADAMTNSGTKVETVEKLGDDIQNVVAGRLISVTPHPDSDHLLICSVDVGSGEPIQIVTGAQNVAAGDMVPVCLNGAHLPGGKVIKSGKLRGVLSDGMLCSLSELGLTVHDFPYATEDGIFIMQEDCKPGDDIRKVLMLEDTVIDFELTFNRPDCIALLGIAREAAAATDEKLDYTYPSVKGSGDGDTIENYLSVTVKEPQLCPRYTARAVKNVKIQPSPLWMRARLRSCGIRPINNIVDITNYVMLEYGQPMHAFDRSYITSGSIVVRKAQEGESIVTLDGTKRELTADMLCIADGEKPVALAGIMGGENSEITDSTTTVIFESASFSRSSIRRTSRAVGLSTDSSKRYEKGIPPCTAADALERACELVELLGAGTVVDGRIDVLNADISERYVDFDYRKVNSLLGINIPEAEMKSILERIGFGFDAAGRLAVPPYRGDIINTADIAEEVVRIYGLDKIPSTRFIGEMNEGGESERRSFGGRINDLLAGLGFYEIYTYSFISPKVYDRLGLAADDARRDSIRILNPLGDDTSVMRTTALGSLLSALARNSSHRVESCMLFENATVYFKSETDMSKEEKQIVAGFYGCGDFYDMKGTVEALAERLYIGELKFVADGTEPCFHPGRCAAVYAGGRLLGRFGQVHPEVCSNFELPDGIFAAVLSAEALFECSQSARQYVPLPVYPSVERDLALVMDDDVEAGSVADSIKAFAGKSLCGVSVFDVYKGKGVPEGKKSVAYRLSFRLPDKTMNDAEAEAAVSKILRRLEAESGIVLRA